MDKHRPSINQTCFNHTPSMYPPRPSIKPTKLPFFKNSSHCNRYTQQVGAAKEPVAGESSYQHTSLRFHRGSVWHFASSGRDILLKDAEVVRARPAAARGTSAGVLCGPLLHSTRTPCARVLLQEGAEMVEAGRWMGGGSGTRRYTSIT